MALYFLLSLIAFGYIVLWSIRNDRAHSVKDQTGLLRMSATSETPAPEAVTDERGASGQPRARRTGPVHRPGRKRMWGPGR